MQPSPAARPSAMKSDAPATRSASRSWKSTRCAPKPVIRGSSSTATGAMSMAHPVGRRGSLGLAGVDDRDGKGQLGMLGEARAVLDPLLQGGGVGTDPPGADHPV